MSSQELCAICGEDTAPGSPLFSDREVAHRNDETRYVCALCATQLRGSREVHTDEERERYRARLDQAAFGVGLHTPGGH